MLLLLFFVGLATFAILLMGIQGLKRLFGIPLVPPFPASDWTAADQSLFFSGEKVDPETGLWRSRQTWPGLSSGRAACTKPAGVAAEAARPPALVKVGRKIDRLAA
ncbi:MAG: hypothetical protein R3B90_18210 [Planctomycetaceae bacterium]